jgi:tetratricopeptide (TPR) repeat protein
MTKRPLVVALFAGICLLATSRAAAAPDATAKARAMFKQAEVHFSVGEFGKALELYKEAYKAKPLPGFLFNMGQCHRHLGEYKRALFLYQQYLDRVPDAPNKDEVKMLMGVCERKLVAPVEEPKETPAAAPAPPPPAVKPAPEPTPPKRPGRRRLHRAWFWSGVALTGALAVTGTVTGVLALNQSSEYKDGATSFARRSELKDSGELLGTLSTATFAAAGGTAAVTLILYFFTDFHARERTVSATALPGGGAVVVGGTF